MRERERYGGLRERERRDGYGGDERERYRGFWIITVGPRSIYVYIPRRQKKKIEFISVKKQEST